MPVSKRAHWRTRILAPALLLTVASLAVGEGAAKAKSKNAPYRVASLEAMTASPAAPDLSTVLSSSASSASSASSSSFPTHALPAQARFFTINQVLAKHDAGILPSEPVRLASVGPGNSIVDAPVSRSPLPAPSGEPFDLFTFRAPEGLLWVKWRGLEAEMGAEAKVIAPCRTEPDRCSSPAAARFLAIADGARALEGRARLQQVNREVNGAIRYRSDLAQHGVPDLWSAPLASFASGFGDCEDYVIAKYAILREAGVAADDLRLLLVRDKAVRRDHAVLAARHEGRWLLLDNRHLALLEDTESKHFMPMFALDHQGVKLIAAPYAMRPAHDNAAVAPAATAPGDAAREADRREVSASGRDEAMLLL